MIVPVEGIFVRIETPQRIGSWRRLIAIHRRILLMAEDDAFPVRAISARLGTLSAFGFLFAALEFSLTTGRAVQGLGVSGLSLGTDKVETHQPVLDLMAA